MTRTAKCPHCGGLTVPPRETAVDIRVAAIRALAQDLSGCHDDAWRFFTSLFDADTPFTTIKQLAYHLGVDTGLLLNRFARAGLPSPKQYVAQTRMLRVAESFPNDQMSVRDILSAYHYSSPQTFNRHVQVYYGVTATELRQAETQRSLLERFRRELVHPYQGTWLTFRPTAQLARGAPTLGLRRSRAHRKAVAA